MKTRMALACTGLLMVTGWITACGTAGPAAPVDEARSALDREASRERGSNLYRSCATCHGADGAGDAGALVPRIAGQHYSVIIRQLADFRAGRRHDERMRTATQEHHLDGPGDLADVATYINLLKPVTRAAVGDGMQLEVGLRLYEAHCAGCHGAAAQGSDSDAVPRLAGQHAAYLDRQFKDIAKGDRPGVSARHRRLLARLEFQETSALADYLSRLTLLPMSRLE